MGEQDAIRFDGSENGEGASSRKKGSRLFGVGSIVGILACLAVYLGLWAAVAAADGGMLAMDEAAYQAISVGLRSDDMTETMEAVSTLGTFEVIVALIVVVLVFAPKRRTAVYCAVSALAVHYLNKLLKALVCRPRPEAALALVVETGYSFPSGHAMNAVALFGLFAWFAWRSDRPKLERQIYCLVFALVAAIVCISRVYLGVHYLSDVLAGVCAAILWLVLYTRLILFIEGKLAKRSLRKSK